MKDLHPNKPNILCREVKYRQRDYLLRINTDIIGFTQIYLFHDSVTDPHSESAVMGIYVFLPVVIIIMLMICVCNGH